MQIHPEHLLDFDLARVTLLAVFAHPDDETYLAGGLMAAVSRAGGRVVHVTATMGELGTPDPERWPPAAMARLRRRELRQALAELGVTETTNLGYADGACDQADVRQATRRLTKMMRRLRPDVVVGFGPDGVTGHSDHIAAGRWIELATKATGNDVPLLTSASSSVWPADLEATMRTAGAFMPGYRRPVDITAPAELDLDDHLLERKLAALAAHGSQTGPLRDYLGESDFRRMVAIEAFRPANAAARRRLVESTEPQPMAAVLAAA